MSQGLGNLGFVLFDLDAQTFATALEGVREIVRLHGLEQLPGSRPPLAGLTVVRGTPLPVLDIRTVPATVGDVLVVRIDDEPVGIAVDKVHAVIAADELPAGAAPSRSLPEYVVGVRRHGTDPVLLVDLRVLLDTIAAGWAGALAPVSIPSPR